MNKKRILKTWGKYHVSFFLLLWAVLFLDTNFHFFSFLFFYKRCTVDTCQVSLCHRKFSRFWMVFPGVPVSYVFLPVLHVASLETISDLKTILSTFQSVFFWLNKFFTLLKVFKKHHRIEKYWIEYNGFRFGNYFLTLLLQLIQQT